MNINEIRSLLDDVLNNPNDEVLKKKYNDGLSAYFSTQKEYKEILPVVVKGIDIDKASHYFESVKNISKIEIQSVWKNIRESKEIIENKYNNGLKFVCYSLVYAVKKYGLLHNYLGVLISKLVSMIESDKRPIKETDYKCIIHDCFISNVKDVSLFPDWEKLKIQGNDCKVFNEILISLTSNQRDEELITIKNWATLGIRHADKLIEKELIEAQIPKSKILELQAILDHYKVVEKQVSDNVYKLADRDKEVSNLKSEVESLLNKIQSLEKTINVKELEIQKFKDEISEKNKEITERKRINDAADALKKNDEEGLLKDIANELKAEYGDFIDSENDEMDITLGEIYREKIRNIFKILDKKGIIMG